jgi:PKD repeat protein
MKYKYFIPVWLFFCLFLHPAHSSAQVNFSVSPSSGCRPLPVTFTSLCGPTAVNYSWYFGDGGTSNAASPTYTYLHGGSYYPYCQVYDANFNFLGGWQGYVGVGGAQDSLNVSTNAVCPGDMVSFYCNLTNTLTSITWDFGDSYMTTNPYNGTQHVYAAPGVYLVKATVTSSCGIDTSYAVIHVAPGTGFPNPPQFQLQTDSICPNDQAMFWTAWSYQNYVLDFGDGNYITHSQSSNNNSSQVQHVYSTPGTYIASITYTNACGLTTVVTQVVHVVTNHNITGPLYMYVNYGDHGDTSCYNMYVQFQSNPNNFDSYLWDFGAGDTSHSANPSHKFTAVGNYPVKLTVSNGCGNTKTIIDTVHIVNNLPFNNLNTSVTPSTICPGQQIIYNAGPTGDPSISFSWNFGDATTSTVSTGSHTFSALGTYSVICVGRNSCGSTDTSRMLVTVANNVVPNKNDYHYGSSAHNGNACPGDSIVFIFAPAGSGTVNWNFGDTHNANATQTLTFQDQVYNYVKHAYSATGIYHAVVTYTNPCGNSFTDSITITIRSDYSDFGQGPGNIILYDASVYPCQGMPINFHAIGGLTYVWNFGDNTGNLVTHQTLTPVSHAFQNPGRYLVSIRAINACGNTGFDTVVVNIPASLISITTNSVASHCHHSDGKAIAIASGGTLPYSYQWSNGNSQFLADSISAGIYVVTITDANGCSNFKIATVNDAEAPAIAVNVVQDVSCYGGNNGAIAITVIGSSAPYTYNWSTGATSQNINNLVAGPKEITVIDANGCSASRSINVGESPPVLVSTVTHNATCGNSDGEAIAAVSGTTGPYNYIWSNSANTALNSGLLPGSYTVTVVDNNGCLYTASATVSNVNGPAIYLDSITGTGCGTTLSKIYTHAAGGTAPYTYSWSTGATTANLLNAGVGHYIFTVTGHDGCQSVREFDVTHDQPTGNPICLVSVDTLTGTNEVVWEKPVSNEIAYYNIYKESSQSGLYYQVDTIQYNSLSIWTDPVSDPQIRSWKYKITMVDQCGDESPLSSEHKTIHLNVNLGIGGSYNLIWDEYIGFSYSTYKIYRHTTVAGPWTLIATVPASVLSYTDVSPPANTASYMVEAVPNFSCAPTTHAAINSTRSNIKTVFNNATGIENQVLNEQVGMYPNPSSGSVNLIYPGCQDGYVLTVYNSLGQAVYAQRISRDEAAQRTNTKTIDLSGLAEGIYVVTLDNNSTRVHKKLILH